MSSAALSITWLCFGRAQVFKYVSFSKTMSQLEVTLGACARDLAGFSIMFGIVFVAFAQLGYLAFGTQVAGFSSIGQALYADNCFYPAV